MKLMRRPFLAKWCMRAFVLVISLHLFGCVGFTSSKAYSDSPHIYKSIEEQERLVDVLGWEEIRWDMNRRDLIKIFGGRLKPLTPVSLGYVIGNVSFGSLKTDLKVLMIHMSEDGMDDPVSTYYARSVEPFNKERIVGIFDYFVQMYGQPEVQFNGFYSYTPRVHKTQVKWTFPTTTISLVIEQKIDEEEIVVFIRYDEVISEKHSITISKKKLDNMRSKVEVFVWNKMPVFILQRDKNDIEFISSGIADKHLVDPTSYKEPHHLQKRSSEKYPFDFISDFVQKPFRSIRKEIGVFVASGPNSGCIPVLLAEETRSNKHFMREQDTFASRKWGKAWMNGFYDPCSDDYFDMSGRVYEGDNYGANMGIPKHHYDDDGNLIIGY